MSDNAIQPAECTDVQVVDSSPASMVQMALSRGANLNDLEKFLDLQTKWEEREAKKAYVKAMSAFRAEGVTVFKDKHNKQYDSKYTSLGNLVNTAIPALSKHGLSHKWETQQEGDLIRVTCVMTHEMGHSESTTMEGPPDSSGAKNALQKVKSTVTYLKLATFEAITGLASVEGNMDDDGNASGTPADFITAEQVSEISALVEKKGGWEKFHRWMSKWCPIEAVDEIPAKAYKAVMDELSR